VGAEIEEVVLDADFLRLEQLLQIATIVRWSGFIGAM